MAFDFNQVLADPQFHAGIGILGASRKPEGLMAAYEILNQQRMQEAKLQAEQSQRALEQERMGLYRQQVEQSQANTALQRQKFAAEERRIQALQKMAPIFMQAAQGADMKLEPTEDPVQMLHQMKDSPAPMDVFEKKLLPLENKRNPDGTWPVSPKGAIGPAQVMPDTGPEAAALAGLPWDPERLKNDETYNLSLGKAYFHKQLQDFGNLPMAFAAYNAGPGALRRAMERSKKNFGNESAWYAFLPDETKKYVKDGTGYVGGLVQQQQSAKGIADQYAAQVQKHKQLKGMAAGMLLSMGDQSGLTMGIDAMKPDSEGPRMKLDEKRIQLDEQRVGIEGGRASEQKRHNLEQEAAARKEEERKAKEATYKRQGDLATYKASHTMIDTAMDEALKQIDSLITDKGLKAITGKAAYTNPIAVKGSDAYNALAKLKSIQSKLVNDTLQSVRAASKSGASGYGQFTEKELEVIKTYIEDLDPGRGDFLQALENVKARLAKIRSQSSEYFKEATGRVQVIGPNGKAGTIPADQLEEALRSGYKRQ